MKSSTQRALEAADWNEIGRKLTAYAQHLLDNRKWRTGNTVDVAGGRAARDFAHDAIAKMSGYDADRGPLLPHLKALVEREVSNASKSAENRRERSIRLRPRGEDGAPEELHDYIERHQKEAAPSAEEVISGPGERVAALFEAVDGDDELTALLDTVMRTGEATAQPLAKELGTTEADINNRLKKLRRLAKKIIAKTTPGKDRDGATEASRTDP